MAPWSHAAFSDDLALLSACGADGKVRIFSTKNSKAVQEFVPDGHLNEQIRSLHWISAPAHLELKSSNTQSKKRKVVLEDSPDKKLLLLGQAKGSVLLYSCDSAEVVGKLTSDSSSPVNALAWAKGNDVFAGLSNGQIVRWTLPNTHCVKLWKSSRKGDQVNVLAVHPTEPWLISASRSITVWDIETQKPLASFLGHESPIRQLLFTPTGDHLASIATNDRNVNVWPLHKLKEGKSSSSADPVAMFVLQDYPVQMDLAISSVDGTVKLSAVTEEGSLYIFSETINGKLSKPSKPHLTIQIAESTAEDENAPAKTIPILSAQFNSDSATHMVVCYGDGINSRFETVELKTEKQLMVLLRYPLRKARTPQVENNSRIKGDTSEAQYVTPVGTKRPLNARPVHLPIEDRLKNLSVDKYEDNESRIPNGPSSDSLSKLLQQGLSSSDFKMQKEILLKRDPAVISSTVAELPLQCLMALVQELIVLVHWRGWRGEAATMWLNEVLVQHSSVVLGCPQLMDMMQPILGLVEVRLATHYSMAKLKGRLSMLLSQMTLRGKIKKMSPQQNEVTTFDIEDESDSSSDEDNLIDTESEAENSDEMEDGEDSDESEEDEEEDGDSEEVEEDGEGQQEEEVEQPTVDSRTRKKRKSDTGQKMELDD